MPAFAPVDKPPPPDGGFEVVVGADDGVVGEDKVEVAVAEEVDEDKVEVAMTEEVDDVVVAFGSTLVCVPLTPMK